MPKAFLTGPPLKGFFSFGAFYFHGPPAGACSAPTATREGAPQTAYAPPPPCWCRSGRTGISRSAAELDTGSPPAASAQSTKPADGQSRRSPTGRSRSRGLTRRTPRQPDFSPWVGAAAPTHPYKYSSDTPPGRSKRTARPPGGSSRSGGTRQNPPAGKRAYRR